MVVKTIDFFDEIEAYKWRNWKAHFSKPKDILESGETRKYAWMYNVMLDPTEVRISCNFFRPLGYIAVPGDKADNLEGSSRTLIECIK